MTDIVLLRYVGPSAVLEASRDAPRGVVMKSDAALFEWARGEGRGDDGWATYVVNEQGELVLAPRRSEHVACAGGEAVLAAGELRIDDRGARIEEISNNSTGYCPPESSWAVVATAVAALGVEHPPGFTFVARFRRCPACGERNLVKDDDFSCAICDAPLPIEWNVAARDC